MRVRALAWALVAPIFVAAPAFASATPAATIADAGANITAVTAGTGGLSVAALVVVAFPVVLLSGKLLSTISRTGFKWFRGNS